MESLNGWKALGNLNASEVMERGVTLMCVCVCVLGVLWDGVKGVGDGTTLALLWHYSCTDLILLWYWFGTTLVLIWYYSGTGLILLWY